jgi:hypothetical protein
LTWPRQRVYRVTAPSIILFCIVSTPDSLKSS